MNKGNNAKPKYYCDKCGEPIRYVPRKGLVNRYNYGLFTDYAYHKAFDLCNKCNNEFKKWLKTKPIPERITTENKIKEFDKYDERAIIDDSSHEDCSEQIKNYKIISVVTHEQFKGMEYRV